MRRRSPARSGPASSPGARTAIWELVFKASLFSCILVCLAVLVVLLVQIFDDGVGSLR